MGHSLPPHQILAPPRIIHDAGKAAEVVLPTNQGYFL